jgi:predicted nucleotidyltransferase
MEPPANIPPRFHPAYQHIRRLVQHERYQAALIFGSLARGEATGASDMDVKIVTDEDNLCANINHPVIGGVKLDLSFSSISQLRESLNREIASRERIPILAESLIVFDKTGELTEICDVAKTVQPRKLTPDEFQFLQFMFYHGNDKAERNLQSDPVTALLVMHVGLNDFLQFHYRIRGRWWVSSKRLLADLRSWDPALARLVERFVMGSDAQAKFQVWSDIIDHIVEPLGGRQPIAENNCDCAVCRVDLARVVGAWVDA